MWIPADGLIEMFCRHSINRGEIGVQKDTLTSNLENLSINPGHRR